MYFGDRALILAVLVLILVGIGRRLAVKRRTENTRSFGLFQANSFRSVSVRGWFLGNKTLPTSVRGGLVTLLGLQLAHNVAHVAFNRVNADT